MTPEERAWDLLRIMYYLFERKRGMPYRDVEIMEKRWVDELAKALRESGNGND